MAITTNADTVADGLAALGATVEQRGRALVGHWGMRLNAAVKAHAAGRPGPRMITGDYNRSITLDVTSEGTAFVARVGTNKPQGRRLEMGFVGADSLGRHYQQPPFPHFGPGFDETANAFEAAVHTLGSGAN